LDITQCQQACCDSTTGTPLRKERWKPVKAALTSPCPSLGRTLRFVRTRHGCTDAAPGSERADDPAADRLAGGHEVIEQLVDERLVEDALVAVAVEIQLQRFQLHAAGRRGVG